MGFRIVTANAKRRNLGTGFVSAERRWLRTVARFIRFAFGVTNRTAPKRDLPLLEDNQNRVSTLVASIASRSTPPINFYPARGFPKRQRRKTFSGIEAKNKVTSKARTSNGSARRPTSAKRVKIAAYARVCILAKARGPTRLVPNIHSLSSSQRHLFGRTIHGERPAFTFTCSLYPSPAA